MKRTPLRRTALTVTVLFSTITLSSCSLGSYLAANTSNGSGTESSAVQESKAPSTMELTETTSSATPATTTSTTPDKLAVDTSAYTEDDLKRAREVTANFFTGFRNSDFALACKLSADTSLNPPYIVEDAINLKACETTAAAGVEGIDFSMLNFSADQLEAKDVGGGFAEMHANGMPVNLKVVKLNNGEIYVDVANFM